MTGQRDATRIIRSWLEDGVVTQLPDRVLDAVLAELPATPQRRVFRGGATMRNLNPMAYLGLATAAVLVVVATGLAVLASGPSLGGPIETLSPTPSPSPMALPDEWKDLDPGTYVVGDPFPVRVTFEVPAGWSACNPGPLERGVCRDDDRGVGFMIVENVVSDPCDPSERQLEPPVGPSVDDLVTAISNLAGFRATDPVDITVDGFAGKQFEVTAPAANFCDGGIFTWSNARRTNGVGPREVNLLRIIDVGGTRLLVSAAHHPGMSTAQVAELRRVFESVHVAP